MGKIYEKFMTVIAKCIFPKPEFVFEEPLEEGEAVIFTANHAQAIGPVITTLYFPKPIRPWSVAQILDKKTAAGFIFYDFFAGANKKCKWFWHFLSHVVSVFLRPLLRAANGISVYHDKRLASTLTESVDALAAGTNLVIFPECPEKFSEHINDFYGGFVKLGELYHQKTGKNLKFYPTYIAKPLRKVLVGKPIEYSPDKRGSSYRKQLAAELRDRTEQLASSLPPHKVTPFLTEEWYAAYGHYWDEGRMLDYWNLCQADLAKRERRKKKSSADSPATDEN